MKIARYAMAGCESLVIAYCILSPYHRGKGRLVNTLVRFIPPLGRGQRHAVRHGLLWELNLDCFIQRAIYYDCYEPWETRYLQKIVQPGWNVIDVGANIGYYSLLVGNWVGANGVVHAFEPQEDMFAHLCRHISMNKMAWIKPHKCALGDRTEQRYMTALVPSNRGVQRIATANDACSNPVQVTTLDEFVSREHINRIDLIKVDIEGFECKFINGAQRTLTRFNPMVLIELNPDTLSAYNTSVHAVVDSFHACGYVLYQLDRRKVHALKNLPANGHYCNIIGRPQTASC